MAFGVFFSSLSHRSPSGDKWQICLYGPVYRISPLWRFHYRPETRELFCHLVPSFPLFLGFNNYSLIAYYDKLLTVLKHPPSGFHTIKDPDCLPTV